MTRRDLINQMWETHIRTIESGGTCEQCAESLPCLCEELRYKGSLTTEQIEDFAQEQKKDAPSLFPLPGVQFLPRDDGDYDISVPRRLPVQLGRIHVPRGMVACIRHSDKCVWTLPAGDQAIAIVPLVHGYTLSFSKADPSASTVRSEGVFQ